MEVDEIIERLGLEPHPERGWYRRTWAHEDAVAGRPLGSAIYYLLEGGVWSRWHRVDAVELWHHYAGAPLELAMRTDGAEERSVRLGDDLVAGDRPQVVVPQGVWQRARSLGAYTLVGCTVVPAFVFEGFELAPEEQSPGT